MISSRISIRIILTLAAAGVALMGATPAAADTVLVSYQGILTDSSNGPVPEGTYQMEFRFYDDSAGATPLWTDLHQEVYVGPNGQTHTFLSFVDEYVEGGFEDMNAIWMEILVAGEATTPRTRLASVPHAAGARRVVGDILTRPGMVLVSNSADDSAIVLAAVGDTHAIRIHPPEPCVPPDPCTPALELIADVDSHALKIHPPDPCVPPEPCVPAFELIADAEVHTLKIHPPDPCASPPCTPATTITAGNSEVDFDISITTPSDDDVTPISMGTSWGSQSSHLRISGPTAGSPPQVEMVSTAAACTVMVQGYDPAGNPPRIAIVAGTEGARVGIGTDSPTEALDVRGVADVEGLSMATGASDGHVLTSDAVGNASWQAPSVPVVKCGLETGVTNGSGQISFTFPAPFPATPTLTATAQFISGNLGQMGRVSIVALDQNGFTLSIIDGNRLALASASVQISWVAVLE